MADLKQTRYQFPDGSYADSLRTYADAAANLVTSLPAGSRRRILDALGRVISEVDEATGDAFRTRFSDAAEGPRLTLRHDTASPAPDDVIGRLAFQTRNDAGALYTGVELRALVKNAAAGAEEVWFEAGLMNAGAFVPAGLSLRVVGGALKLYVDGAEVGTGGAAAAAAASLTHSADQSIPHNTHTPLLFNTEDFDTAGWHSTSTNPSRLTVDTDGVYHVAGSALLGANANGERQAYFAVDGAWNTRRWGWHRDVSPGASISWAVNCSAVISLNAGQYVEIYLYQSSAAALACVAGLGMPNFTCVRVAD